jgi:hypothetical protein
MLTEYDIDAPGWDDLRMAIIRQALLDYKDGLIVERFLTYDVLDEIDTKERRDDATAYLSAALKDKKSAIDFFRADCGIVKGDLKVAPLVKEMKRQAAQEIKLLNTPCTMFVGKRHHRIWYKDYPRLFDAARDIFPTIRVPTYILSKVDFDRFAVPTLEFAHNGQKYFGIVAR